MLAWRLGLALFQAGSLVSNDEAELARLEHVWNDAHLRGDAAALEALWADDLVVTVPKMPPIKRDVAVSMARSGRIKFTRYESSDLQVRIDGDTAVVTGTLERARTMNGAVVQDHWQFTKVYLRRKAAWRVIAFHASEAPEP